jgi:arylsulfatase A-like enzyme
VNRPLPWNELTEVQREFQAAKMAVHAAMVDRIDREVGRVIDQLEAMGALDNTLILFASDNGASAEIMVRGDGHDPQAPPGSAASYLCLGPGWSSSSNTPLRRHKVWVHEGGCSTPMIMHWPRGIAARGELRRYPAHLIDVAPTLLELAGGKPATPARSETAPAPPGRSLVSVLTRDEATRTEPLWWLHEGNRAIRVGDWKLVMARDEDWQLYDLSCDRGETNNLADQYPDKARQLAQQWQQMADQFFAHAASP